MNAKPPGGKYHSKKRTAGADGLRQNQPAKLGARWMQGDGLRGGQWGARFLPHEAKARV